MNNQNFKNDCLAFPDQFNNLLQHKMYAAALTLAEERLQAFPMDADAYAAVGRTLIAMGHSDQVRNLLCDLGKNISVLSAVHARLWKLYAETSCEMDTPPSGPVLQTLSDWLENIRRIRAHAADIK